MDEIQQLVNYAVVSCVVVTAIANNQALFCVIVVSCLRLGLDLLSSGTKLCVLLIHYKRCCMQPVSSIEHIMIPVY